MVVVNLRNKQREEDEGSDVICGINSPVVVVLVFVEREKRTSDHRNVQGIARLKHAVIELVYDGNNAFDGYLDFVAKYGKLVSQLVV